MSNLKFAVIGAGAGGQSMAAILTDQGYKVSLHDINIEIVDRLNELGRIELSGAIELAAFPELVTDDLKKATDNADIIMVVTTTDAHEKVACQLSPYLKNRQLIILNPGFAGGSLAFMKALRDNGCKAEVIVAETADLIYTCRKLKEGSIYHSGLKKRMEISALPASYNDKLMEILKPVFPIMVPADNVLYTGLKNSGAMLHSIPMIMNVNRIDEKQAFDYYVEGVSESIAKMIEKADRERLAVSGALGFKVPSVVQNIQETYGLKENDLCRLLKTNKAYMGIKSPQNLQHRFLVEDTLSNLVPLASIGSVLGVKTPVINAFIEIISAATGRDFASEGRTAEKIGLTGKTIEEIYNIIQ